MPISLCISSSARGMNIITATPTSGRNVPTVSTQFWSVRVWSSIMSFLTQPTFTMTRTMANTAAAANSNAPYWLTRPDWTG